AVTQWRRVTPTSDLRPPTSLLTLASGFWHLASLVAAPPRYVFRGHWICGADAYHLVNEIN
ncbi:MAG: hypothetical protein WC378_16040, partial [Opitutaceae bacterium]